MPHLKNPESSLATNHDLGHLEDSAECFADATMMGIQFPSGLCGILRQSA